MFTLKFDTDNVAFDPESIEVARILRDIARKVEAGWTSWAIWDANGNRVGEWALGDKP
jgi:hypothetical protein